MGLPGKGVVTYPGLTARTRTVAQVVLGKGAACTAPLVDTGLCYKDKSGVLTNAVGSGASSVSDVSKLPTCSLADWGDWGSCSVPQDPSQAGTSSCGYGYAVRQRRATNDPCILSQSLVSAFKASAPSSGSSDVGSLVETRLCNNNACDVDCKVGPWSS